MTKDMNEMKKKRGRPALGRTRKLTKGVTVKFSPVSYEALRFRARKSGRSLAVYIREAALAATVTARHHRRRTHCCAAWREWLTT